MQIQLKDLVNAKGALEELLTLKTTASVAFTIVRNARKINAVLEDFDKAQKGLYLEYGVAEGNRYTVPVEKQPKFLEELNALLEETIDIDLRVITEAQLEECMRRKADFTVPVNAVFNAGFMFVATSDEVVSEPEAT